jgi:hypothetical protein
MAKYLSGLLAFYLAYKAVWQKLGLNNRFATPRLPHLASALAD